MQTQRFRRLGRVVPVLRHALRRVDDHLADLAARHLRLAVLDVDDPHVDVRKRHSDRAELVGALHGVLTQQPSSVSDALDHSRAVFSRTGFRLGHQRRRAEKHSLIELRSLFPLARRGVENRV